MYVAGLMSGTSLDGMDAALLFWDEAGDGRANDDFPNVSFAYSANQRQSLQRAVDDALQWQFNGPAPKSFERASQIITEAGHEAIEALYQKTGLTTADMRAVGFHGQTVLHIPPRDGQRGQTLQIGDGQGLANLCQTQVIHSFRQSDMAQGGHGAPLAPAWHFELARRQGRSPSVFLNIGGVSNITFIPETQSETAQEKMIAFDCGPGNGPLDAWMQSHQLGLMDKDGVHSALGQINYEVVAKVLATMPSVGQAVSLDRWAFDAKCVAGLSVIDGAATLVEITAQGIERGIRSLPVPPVEILVGGGGRLNPVLMQRLGQLLGKAVIPCETAKIDGDMVEAQAFAWLAIRRILNKPASWPGTTGAIKPVVCGTIAAFYDCS